MVSKKYYRHIFKLTFFVLAGFYFSGCETTNMFKEKEEEKVRKVIAFHARAEAGRTDPMNIVVKAKSNGKTVDIKLQKLPLITSERFSKVEAVKKEDGTYSLRLYLDKHAQIRWQADSVKYQGMPIVVLVDDKPFAWWRVEEMADAHDFFTVDCSLPKELAEDIAAASRNNYIKLSHREWLESMDKK